MKKKTWLSLLCCLLMLCCAACGAKAEQTDVAVRVGDVVYDLQTVQSALTSSRLLYETAGVSLNDEQERQLALLLETVLDNGARLAEEGSV